MIVRLQRVNDPRFPQVGVLSLEDVPFCCTLELPNLSNKPNVSCIPAGTYIARRTFNRKTSGGLYIDSTFEVIRVPGRSGILFHVGNTIKDTRGCILLGEALTLSEFKITLSTKAFKRFISTLKDFNEFELRIYDAGK